MANSLLDGLDLGDGKSGSGKSGGGKGILGRLVNTVSNDVVAPIKRDVVAPIAKAGQAVNEAAGALHDEAPFVSPPTGDAVKQAGGAALKGLLLALDKPGQAVRSGLAYASESAYKGKNPLASLGSFALGAGKGLVGKEHTSFSQAVGAAETGHPVAKKLPLGLETVGSTVLDPLSYLDFGASRLAEVGLDTLGRTAGEDVAKDVVAQGLKNSGHEALLRDSLAQAGKSEGQIDKIVTAVNRSGRGGLKFAGRSIPGLTAESAAGQAASGVRSAIGEKVGQTGIADVARGIFRREGPLTPVIGKDAAEQLVGASDVARHGSEAKVRSVASGLGNALNDFVKEHGRPPTEDELGSIRKVLDIPEAGSPLQTLRAQADAAVQEADSAARATAKASASSTAYHSVISDAIRTHLTDARTTLEDAKQSLADAAAKYGSTDFDPKAVGEQVKAVDKATKALDSLSLKYANSSTRQGVEQMARVEADKAAQAARDLETAKAAQESAHGLSALDYGKQALQAEGKSHLAPLVDALHAVRTQTEAAQGSFLHSGIKSDEYLGHFLTTEGRNFLENNPDVEKELTKLATREPGIGSVVGQRGHMQARVFNDTIDHINELARSRGFDGKLMEDNPVAVTFKRAQLAHAATEQRNFLDAATKIVGDDGKPILHEVTEPGEAANLDLTDTIGKKYAGHPEVVKAIQQANQITGSPDELGRAVRGLEKAQSFLKQYYIATPSFHARKFAGDYWMATIAGVRNPAWFERGFALAHAVSDTLKDIRPGESFEDAIGRSGLTDAQRKDAIDFYNNGGTSNFVESEIKHGGDLANQKASKVGRALSKIPEANKKATSFISNGFRAAVYLHTLEETGSRDVAMQTVNKFLFDYGAVTPAEQKIRGRLVPFYTFMRKNVPLQLEQAAKHPRNFVVLKNLEGDLADHGVKEFPKLPPQEASEVLGGLLSPTLKGKASVVTGALSPFVKSPVEAGLGVNDFGEKATPAQNWDSFIKTFVNPYAQRVDTFKKKSVLRSVLGFQPLEPNTTPTTAGAKPTNSLLK